jgi:hypothetical protein
MLVPNKIKEEIDGFNPQLATASVNSLDSVSPLEIKIHRSVRV